MTNSWTPERKQQAREQARAREKEKRKQEVSLEVALGEYSEISDLASEVEDHLSNLADTNFGMGTTKYDTLSEAQASLSQVAEAISNALDDLEKAHPESLEGIITVYPRRLTKSMTRSDRLERALQFLEPAIEALESDTHWAQECDACEGVGFFGADPCDACEGDGSRVVDKPEAELDSLREALEQLTGVEFA